MAIATRCGHTDKRGGLVPHALICDDDSWQVAHWNIAEGLRVPGTNVDTSGSESMAAIRKLTVPDGPRLGVTLDEDFVPKHLVAESGRLSPSECNGKAHHSTRARHASSAHSATVDDG
jgi:hypothetical protein